MGLLEGVHLIVRAGTEIHRGVAIDCGGRPKWGLTSRPCFGSGLLELHVALRMLRIPCMVKIRLVAWAPLASASVLVVLRRHRDCLQAGQNKK